MSNSWMDTVKNTFRTNRKTNKAYKFKDALIDAKKIYKKGANVVMDSAQTGSNMVVKTAKKGSKMVSKSAKRAFSGKKSKGGSKTKKNRKTKNNRK